MRGLILFILLLFSAVSHSQTFNLPQITTFPVAKPLQFDNGEPVTAINTGILTDALGNPARGPHVFTLSLAPDAAYPVVVRGVTIDPGTSANFIDNLTNTGGVFEAQIFPAVEGVTGSARFSLQLPEIIIQACPDGFTERENDCQRILFDTLVYECAADFELGTNTTDCTRITTITSTEFCDAPFTLQGNQCVHAFSVAAQPECPAGPEWTLSGSTCSFFDTAPVNSCPSGFDLRNGGCHRITVKSSNCDAGFTRNGEVCERIDTQAAAQSCDAGFVLRGDECVREESTPAIAECPDGQLSGSGASATCSIANATSASPVCDPGFVNDGSQCVSSTTQTTSSTQTCPSGHTRVGNTCERLDTANFVSCSSGFELGGGITQGGCHRISTPNFSCPSGGTLEFGWCVSRTCDSGSFNFSTGFCERTVNRVTSVCPIGTQESNQFAGQCFTVASGFEAIGSASSPSDCPSGAVLSEGGRCVFLTPEVAPFCQFGGTFNGTRCVETLTSSPRTSAVEAVGGCGAGQIVSGARCLDIQSTVSAGQCQSGFTRNDSTGQCERRLTANVINECQSGFVLSGTSCIRTVTVTEAFEYECPADTTLDETTCRSTTVVSADLTCSSGFTRSGATCERTLIDDINFSCSAGFTRSNETCSRILTSSLNFFCPSGTNEFNSSSCVATSADLSIGGCQSLFSLNSGNGICERAFTQQASFNCDQRVGDDEVNLSGNTCAIRNFETIQYSCPDGHVQSSDQLTCVETVVEAATPVCADGFEVDVSNDQCVREETQDFLNSASL